jgi:hypothetical protein
MEHSLLSQRLTLPYQAIFASLLPTQKAEGENENGDGFCVFLALGGSRPSSVRRAIPKGKRSQQCRSGFMVHYLAI